MSIVMQARAERLLTELKDAEYDRSEMVRRWEPAREGYHEVPVSWVKIELLENILERLEALETAVRKLQFYADHLVRKS